MPDHEQSQSDAQSDDQKVAQRAQSGAVVTKTSTVSPPPTSAGEVAAPDGEMSVREAGKKGGNTVRDRYGSTFYEEIGRRGGKTTRERHGKEFYEAIGQRGGNVVKEKYGAKFYEEIGQKGGERVRQLIAQAKKTAAEGDEKPN